MLLPFCKQNLKVRSSGHRVSSLRPRTIVPRDDNTIFCVRFFPSRIFETPEAQLVPGFFAERFTGRQIRVAGRHGREQTNLTNENAKCSQKPKENPKNFGPFLFFIIDKAASPTVSFSFHEMLWNEIGWNSDVKVRNPNLATRHSSTRSIVLPIQDRAMTKKKLILYSIDNTQSNFRLRLLFPVLCDRQSPPDLTAVLLTSLWDYILRLC